MITSPAGGGRESTMALQCALAPHFAARSQALEDGTTSEETTRGHQRQLGETDGDEPGNAGDGNVQQDGQPDGTTHRETKEHEELSDSPHFDLHFGLTLMPQHTSLQYKPVSRREPTMTDDRLRRIHEVTDNFFFWQGLRWIPMGAAMLGYAAVSSPRVPIPSPLREWMALPIFAVAIWLSSSVLGRYYARHFGRVRGDPSRHTLRTSVKWLVVYPVIAVALFIDAKFAPPVIVSALALAAGIEAYRQSTGGGREHYIVAAIGLVVFSMLPVLGIVSTGKSILTPLIGVIGLIYIVGGVLDHRELVRILTPVPEKAHVTPV
jgi:hypothetical protein